MVAFGEKRMPAVVPKPGVMPYKNKCTLVIADLHRLTGEIDVNNEYDIPVDYDHGPQTPAEEVMALACKFLKKEVLDKGFTPYVEKEFYPQSCKLVIEDKDLSQGELNMQASYLVVPDFTHGPQSPAESAMALVQTFLKQSVFDKHEVGAILLPDDWGAE